MGKRTIPAPVLGLAAMLVMVAGLACGNDADPVDPAGPGVSTPAASTVPARTPSLQLPAPDTEGRMSLEAAIQNRRSLRDYTEEPLSLDELGQLLWATQGITSGHVARAAPSAGGTYPLEIFAVVGRVSGLEAGVYRYLPHEHALDLVVAGDIRERLKEAALGQTWVGAAAVNFIIAAVYERTTQRYGERGVRYVHMEVGHAAQNLGLQAVALGLGSVPVGAFAEAEVRSIAGLAADEQPLYIIPVGRPQTPTP